MIYDYRAKPPVMFPLIDGCSTVVTDAVTGEVVRRVFYYDTATQLLGRYSLDDAGQVFRVPGEQRAAETWERRHVLVNGQPVPDESSRLSAPDECTAQPAAVEAAPTPPIRFREFL